mmetsp:Transcript_6021/g.14626  ORF Transcript_6021/g.14626 Transcript_6021/m.14626 type:complete len:205 (-) Transcript_6021:288-902(-)
MTIASSSAGTTGSSSMRVRRGWSPFRPPKPLRGARSAGASRKVPGKCSRRTPTRRHRDCLVSSASCLVVVLARACISTLSPPSPPPPAHSQVRDTCATTRPRRSNRTSWPSRTISRPRASGLRTPFLVSCWGAFRTRTRALLPFWTGPTRRAWQCTPCFFCPPGPCRTKSSSSVSDRPRTRTSERARERGGGGGGLISAGCPIS